MTTLLITNPFCRSGVADAEEIERALAVLGPVERVETGSSIESCIHRIGGALERIVVAGGDGTLQRVLPLVLERDVPLGIVPRGTANDLARSLNLPSDVAETARMISEGNVRRIDVGMVNDHYFLNAVGVGLGPELTKKMDREKKQRLGVLAYFQSLVQVMGSRRRRHAVLRVGRQRVRAAFLQITVANGRHYGGGMRVSDEVEMDDGLLHVLCVRPLTPVQLFARGLRLKFGAVKDDEKLLYLKGTEVEIQTRRRGDVTADGELVTTTPIHCKSIPRALSVYVPGRPAETADELFDVPTRRRASHGSSPASPPVAATRIAQSQRS